MNYKNNNNKNKIIIDQVDIITNGTIEQLKTIKNPNEIGKIIDEDNNFISQITPLVMVINQNSKNCQDKIDTLLSLGADPNLKINYYGKDICAYDIISGFNKSIRI